MLTDLYTAPICRCAPPDNKPTPEEMMNCQPYLEREIQMIEPKVFVALGRIAFDRLLKIFPQENPPVFSHGAVHRLKTKQWLLTSYHPSRQNTQTGRLTAVMFDDVWKKIRLLLDS
jgi:uracil-DNA glycosylase family 4